MTINQVSIVSLTDMEKDIIGEVMNISMGAAATAMSTILDKKVSITTPRLETSAVKDYGFSYLEPALGVIIKYIEGIDGLNMLILKADDFKKILSHLLSIDPSEMDEFDEISVSAIGEIMNQMMGAASSALATFLGIKINISPPEIMDTTNQKIVQEKYEDKGDSIIGIKFDITIEDLVKSEFVSIMDPKLAREIIRMSLGENQVSEVEVEQPGHEPSLIEGTAVSPDEGIDIAMAMEQATAQFVQPQVEPQAPVQPQVHSQPMTQPAQPMYQPQPAYQPQPPPVQPQYQPIQASAYAYPQLGVDDPFEQDTKGSNLDLIMSVPVQITVELGKTRRKIKDIAEFAPGNIVELDRQAGDQVDIVANGRLIAKGDVVVVDDNYSVRITEIMKARDHLADIK